MKKNALTYLLLVKFKNQIRELVRKPARLIYFILLIGFIVFAALSSDWDDSGNQAYRNINELTAGITALYILIFAMMAYNGFKNGATMFRMADVNMIFTSPISPRRTLFYGLFQQLGTSLLLGFFFLYQYSWMHNVYGVSFTTIIILLVGYSLSVFCAQLTAMVIYSFTSYDDNRKRIAAIIFFGLFIIYAAGLVLFLLQDRTQLVQNLVIAGNSIYIRLLPVAGWIGSIVGGIILNETSAIITGSVLTAVYIAGMTVLLTYAKQDYYEDVLKASEDQQIALIAKSEGRMAEGIGKVKIGKTGFTKGEGASVFYYKQKIEDRRARKFIVDGIALIFVIVTVILGVFMKNAGIVMVFMTSSYMQFISVKTGRFSKELDKPYIFLVPEPPFKKILYCIKESFTGYLAEAIMIYVPLAFIMQLSPFDTIMIIIARISFAYLFTAANILMLRVFGASQSRTLLYTFYVLSVVIMSVPAIAAGILVSTAGIVLFSDFFVIFAVMTACNIPVTLLVIYLCRNVLQYAELK
ncbi:MAG: putative ABC exporter domain-containing protein [Clostridia bacterium]